MKPTSEERIVLPSWPNHTDVRVCVSDGLWCVVDTHNDRCIFQSWKQLALVIRVGKEANSRFLDHDLLAISGPGKNVTRIRTDHEDTVSVIQMTQGEMDAVRYLGGQIYFWPMLRSASISNSYHLRSYVCFEDQGAKAAFDGVIACR